MKLDGEIGLTLTEAQYRFAIASADERYDENAANGYRNTSHNASSEGSRWRHRQGSLGELALAVGLGWWWDGKGKTGAPDVSTVDVRCTSVMSGHLLLHDDDPRDRAFFLLCGQDHKWIIKGWMIAMFGQLPEFFKERVKDRACFWVPQDRKHLWTPLEPLPTWHPKPRLHNWKEDRRVLAYEQDRHIERRHQVPTLRSCP